MTRNPKTSPLASPFGQPPVRAPKHARHAKPVPAVQASPAPAAEVVDAEPPAAIQSGFSVFNPTPAKEMTMTKADADKSTSKALAAEAKEKARAEREAAKAAKAEAAEKAKMEKAAAKEAKEAEKAAAKAAREAERAAKKAEREARMAELGNAKMVALRDAKARYVKSATGQLRSNDELAQALDAVPPNKVVPLAISLLKLPENPYARMNVGQQSMNLRNKLRGAIRRNTLTIAEVIAERDSGGYALSAEDLAARAPKPRAAKAEAVAA